MFLEISMLFFNIDVLFRCPITTYQHFRSYEDVKKWINSLITSKDASFFRFGIRQLPERRKKVMTSDGQYIQS